ncbi:Mn2+/Fe2+ transporter, NRAMP family [Pseudodesulfovibrio mercurii]|uniref:Divalent metal cation transporter MntH n=1 Tax=Pseudodesulfovibrio mercurii TaxID=641491 RepID=F0JJ21_9BACT|nr:Nramp family divalent metal transporter [Pseudodesulfovibrio mercurii]EGB15920.1 Mn2+/Fe2+ transporter, NRAMP family [Pseudodesulfovibrio mercurii]
MSTVQPDGKSLGEVHGSVQTRDPKLWKRIFAFLGPAYLVSVGYMDPGNWATDLEGGSRFGYALIWVVLMSNMMAVLLQTLAARLGIVTGKDLAQACRAEYSRAASFVLWLFCEVAIAACDLAEVLGTILGLNLLFGLPLLWGAAVTLFDTFLLLVIQRLGIRKMEAFILSLITVIAGGFIVNLFLAKPDWGAAAAGLVPSVPEGSVYIILGIIGATVMPHNLYLHSSLVQTRNVSRLADAKAQACRFNLLDSTIALNAAFFVNAAILVLAAAVFHRNGIVVTEIQQADQMLAQLLGTQVAPIAFGLALLAAGQSSTLTGTLAGQIVMEGFVKVRLRPYLRRLITRCIALLPAVVVIALFGDAGTYRLLILSQVILSLQLPFAIVPLVHFTGDRLKMGSFASRSWVKVLAWLTSAVIIGLNGKLVYDQIADWSAGGAPFIVTALIVLAALATGGFLLYLLVLPLVRGEKGWAEETPGGAPAVIREIETRKVSHVAAALGRDAGDPAIISQALSIAQREGAMLSLVHVTDTALAQVFGSGAGGEQHVYDEHTREDEQYLTEIAEEIATTGVAVEPVLLFGESSPELIKFAAGHNVDMLVMGSHGHRLLGDLLWGETVEPVRHRVNIPILVV